VSDEQLDLLAESARNRGLKLVRSRVRTPGKRRFGKVGLTDARGKAVFGMDDKGPAAEPEEVEQYLRNIGAKDWGASLGVAVMPRKKAPKEKAAERKAAPKRTPANDREPAPRRPPPPPPKPKPKPEVREAKRGDAAAVARLIRLLDHKVDEKGVRKRIDALTKDKLAPLVATLGKEVIGLCGIHRMVTIHRDLPVGRITIIVVDSDRRRQGIGRMLLEAAEEHLRKRGCGLIEATSNDRLTAAHGFYRHMGYERTSIRFAKQL
jgi:GNAT superfamily N-acetyltransferase